MVGRDVVAVGELVGCRLAWQVMGDGAAPVHRVDRAAQHLVMAGTRRDDQAMDMKVGGTVCKMRHVGLDRIVPVIRPRCRAEALLRRAACSVPEIVLQQAILDVVRPGVVQRAGEPHGQPVAALDADHRRFRQAVIAEAQGGRTGADRKVHHDVAVAGGLLQAVITGRRGGARRGRLIGAGRHAICCRRNDIGGRWPQRAAQSQGVPSMACELGGNSRTGAAATAAIESLRKVLGTVGIRFFVTPPVCSSKSSIEVLRPYDCSERDYLHSGPDEPVDRESRCGPRGRLDGTPRGLFPLSGARSAPD